MELSLHAFSPPAARFAGFSLWGADCSIHQGDGSSRSKSPSAPRNRDLAPILHQPSDPPWRTRNGNFLFSGAAMALRAAGGGSASAPLTLASGTIATSSPALTLTQTWNDAAVTFVGYQITITDTASASASEFVDCKVGATTKFLVSKAGVVGAQGGVRTGNTDMFGGANIYHTWGDVTAAPDPSFMGSQFYDSAKISAGQLYGWASKAWNASGALTLDTAFARKAAAIVEVNTGTAGTYTGTALLLGPQTVAQLPAAAAGLKGARASVSDATQTFTSANFGATVTGGGANFVPVVCDGSNWKIG